LNEASGTRICANDFLFKENIDNSVFWNRPLQKGKRFKHDENASNLSLSYNGASGL
jgi:hypothetical protein